MNSPAEPALSIIVPCLNEEPNVAELVRRIQAALALDRLGCVPSCLRAHHRRRSAVRARGHPAALPNPLAGGRGPRPGLADQSYVQCCIPASPELGLQLRPEPSPGDEPA